MEFIPDDGIALACRFLQHGTVLDRNDASGVVDHSGFLKNSGSHGDRSAGCAEHLSEKIMGQMKLISFHAVVAREQPSSQPFFNGVQPIACRCLGRLYKEGKQTPASARKRAAR